MDDQRTCYHCDQQNPLAARFCRRCGQPLDQHQQASPQSGQLTTDAPVLPVPPVPPVLRTPPAAGDRAGPARGPRPGSRRRRAVRRPWTGALLSLVLIAAIAVLAGWQVHWPPAVFGSRNTGQHRPAAGPSSSGPAVPAPAGTTAAGAPSGDIPSGDTPSGDTPSASTESAQQEAAASLAGLLQQSASDRSAVSDAYNDVLRCGPNGARDVQVFQQAVTSRQQLLSQLQDLPSQSALPQSMLQDLSAAWQASATADADYVAWAQDQSAGGCVPNSTGDPHYQAAIGPNQQATADKTSFAILWNQLASQYGYARYQQNDF